MNKLELNDAKSSTTMFMVNPEIETTFQKRIAEKVELMQRQMSGVGTLDGLKHYIELYPNSITDLLTLLGVKIEKFKRVTSAIRMSRGFLIDMEWSEKRLRQEMISNSWFMETFCDLFLKGSSSEQFSYIPSYILEEFRITNFTLAKISNDEVMRSLVKDKFLTEYNGTYNSYYIAIVNEQIRTIAEKLGLTFCSNETLPFLEDETLVTITDGIKKVVIFKRYNLTTSSKQSEDARDMTNVYGQCSERGYLLINMLDGAGWIGRNSDYEKLYYSCHYFLNYKTLEQLSEILTTYFQL